ncbi:SURF1 family protein [Rhizobium sp. G21]|uniref:SURF1 family protein n=1 Tax=Rhizobium sp. G21 TaxID=2758439 RepID=UPI0016034255|nr:SURF1 family protein [Rhizobium sp. G21]MBB1251359.1 SURF1 family protein [Rhizobium sp. G21]
MTKRILLLGLLGLAFLTFVGLGVWQIERLQWKQDLIARVDARIHAAPVAPPETATGDDEYRRIRIAGTYIADADTLTQAVTKLGPGFWVMTPMTSEEGRVILVNRGFIPQDLKDQTAYAAPSGAISVTGLLRLTEPKGGFLRDNDPAAGRWFSRDVVEIARARGLSSVAPFFIDVEAAAKGAANAYPVTGLTVVAFSNHHLQYALTWFAMAALTIVGAIVVTRRGDSDEGSA